MQELYPGLEFPDRFSPEIYSKGAKDRLLRVIYADLAGLFAWHLGPEHIYRVRSKPSDGKPALARSIYRYLVTGVQVVTRCEVR
jgi:hypothetical protein